MDKQKSIKTLVTFEYSNELGCLIWSIPFFYLAIWATLKDKILLIIISILMIFFIANQIYKSFTERKRFTKWIEENDKSIIFFYPTNRVTQDKINEQIGSKLNSRIKQMFYDESKIIGDIKNQNFVKMGLSQLNRLNPNHPRLVQLSGNSLIELMNLYELNRIEILEQERIEEIINEINARIDEF